MEVAQAIYHRRAVRSFTAAPVTAETLRSLIDAAIQAPSAINEQPWRFAVAQRRETLRRIAESARDHLLSLMQTGSPFLRFRDMLQAPGCDILHGAPALVVICATSAAPQAAEDCALAAQNLMLAAYALGLGTCCIGLARPWLNQPEGKRLLGIPAVCAPIVPIIVGEPALVPPATERRAPHIDWIDRPD
ncbi:MAG: nitroreductase family protein [Rhodopila sp.]|nr:nitroreductase family protein [Rhodopila sp.]